MNILVCISSVPDTTSKINFTADSSALDKSGIQWIINPVDEVCLSKAVKLQSSGAKVSVLCIGEGETEAVLRKCLAIGADEAIRVNLSPKDSYSTAKEIEQVVKSGNYDVILCGKESMDYNNGAVVGILAALLGYPFVNSAIEIELQANEAKITREIDGGTETVAVQLPAVIGGQKGLVSEKDIIIPNMRGIMSARTKPLQVLEPTSNEVKANTLSFEKTPARANVKLIEANNLDELVRLLKEEAKVI